MKLSIVIVNYNVKYFLSTCLQSVMKAVEGIEAEVFVVDNNSTDQSVEMVKESFPQVKVIANRDNAGFSRANNQAIDLAQGEYILLLNPDTIVEEECFSRCIEYLDENKDVGGLGVKMIDGAGKFLPESKRGLPIPSVAFCKISGLSRLFPKSKIFGKYHLGYLDEKEISEIEVLSGAFMLIRKSVIDKIGGLDESFFMYGEDIDMSYRITEAGYKNIYFPKSRIIHFKGESTKKSSVNYVLVFYRAMIIFAKKHFSNQNAWLLSLLINMAIYFRALMALTSRFLKRIYMPIIDFALLWVVLFGIKNLYEGFVLGQEGYYPREVELKAFPILIFCWIIGQLTMGGYHQPVKLKNVFKGLIGSALLVLILYAMLNESWRFSRAIVGSSVLASFIILPFSRILLMKLGFFKLIRFTQINSAIIGSASEIKVVKKILSESIEKKKQLFYVNPLEKSETEENDSGIDYIGSLYQIEHIIKVYDLDEVIFCMKDVSASDMFNYMQKKIVHQCSIFLHPENADYLLKSSSIHSVGEFILPETNPEMTVWSKKKKRVFEVIFSCMIFLFSPFLIFIYRKPMRFLKNLGSVISGKVELIGISGETKPFILEAFSKEVSSQELNKLKVDYLMNYGTEKDLEIAISNLNRLDGGWNKVSGH